MNRRSFSSRNTVVNMMAQPLYLRISGSTGEVVAEFQVFGAAGAHHAVWGLTRRNGNSEINPDALKDDAAVADYFARRITQGESAVPRPSGDFYPDFPLINGIAAEAKVLAAVPNSVPAGRYTAVVGRRILEGFTALSGSVTVDVLRAFPRQ